MIRNWFFLYFLCICLSGFAQQADSLVFSNERLSFKPKKIYVPGVLMTAGILFDAERGKISPNENDKGSDLLGFGNHLDDYAQFAPMFAVYGFGLAGMTAKTDWQNRTAILIKGQALNLGLVYVLKKTLKKPRPDGTAYSFPSGHTANAFAGATMLSIEYGENHRWVPYVSYGLATGVGVMRMANDKHYISDVLFGAGLGILSMKVAYWTHKYQWNTTRTSVDPFTDIYQMPN
ncbi:phosphatase PAP2 family protein [Kaistella rhinocerotis]|uniref:phosphatase PAP2 family protein n=1 Tax=Kaistella rhinocerotis TaxID=3026437 RepID=UPI0025558F33|nr:phosphatase PAP2 family protein [Kaistella sp. Ran72]